MTHSNQIIYLDHDPEDVHILETVFAERKDYRLFAFNTHPPFWEHIGSNLDSICLLVLDYNMPGKNGLETFKQFHSRFAGKRIPVILYTETVSITIEDQLTELGGVTFRKPADLETIRKTVNVMIRFCKAGTVSLW